MLPRHEEVVRDRVGGEMRQIPHPEGAQRITRREIEDLLPDVPGMAVPAHRRVLLRHRGVGGDVAVQEIVGEGAQQIRNHGRQLVQVREHRFAEKDVRPRGPRVRHAGEEHEREQGESQRHA